MLPDLRAQEEERLAKEAETESMDVEAKGTEDVEESTTPSGSDLEGWLSFLAIDLNCRKNNSAI